MDERIDSIEKRLESLEKRVGILEKNPEKIEIKKKISIREFMQDKNANSHIKKILLFGYYLEKIEGLNSFNIEDLNELYRKAKEPNSSNPNQMINVNIKQGNIMEAKENKNNLKAWVLTNKGEEYVERGFKENG